MTQLKDMRPSELEEHIQELLRDEGQNKRTALWTITFPLAEAWLLHEPVVRTNGVLKQHGGKKKYFPVKFGKSYNVIAKAEKAYFYKDIALDAIKWLDDGCHGFDTDPGWNGWVPNKVHGPEWIVEVCEAYLNRHDAPPVKQTKADDEGQENEDDKLIEPLTMERATDLLAEGEKLKKISSDRLSEIARLDAELDYERKRVRQLEDVLIEHRIPLPQPDLPVEMRDLLDGLVDDATEQADEDQSDDDQTDEEQTETTTSESITPVVKKRGGARPGAGRKKKIPDVPSAETIAALTNNVIPVLRPE